MGAYTSSTPPDAPAAAGTPPSSSSPSSVSSTSTNGTGATPPNTNPTKKRKNAASALNIMRRKRIRPTLIDDRVAIAFLRELGLTRQWINSGTLLAWALSPSDPDFINIHDYVERSQDRFGVKILTILRIIPKVNSLAEDDSILDFNLNPKTAGKHRMMLWHGTRAANVPGILQNGLKLPQHSGLFGAGIYFADRVAKSASYTDSVGPKYLFLCDVLLDKIYSGGFFWPCSSAPKFTQSVQGLGQCVPDPDWNMKIDGCTWPLGPTVQKAGRYLYMNEYIIYKQSQVQPKYLVKFEITQQPVTYKLY